MPRRLGIDSYDEEDTIDCEECDAGAACGMCLVLVLQDECPTGIDELKQMIDADGLAIRTQCLDVFKKEACEGSGECGTSDSADNCLTDDIYRRVECYGDFLLDPQSDSPPSPPPPPPTPSLSPQTVAALGTTADASTALGVKVETVPTVTVASPPFAPLPLGTAPPPVTIVIVAAVGGSAVLLAIVLAVIFYSRRTGAKAAPRLSRVSSGGEQNDSSDQSRLSTQDRTSEHACYKLKVVGGDAT